MKKRILAMWNGDLGFCPQFRQHPSSSFVRFSYFLTFIILCFFQKATMHHKILQSVVSVGSDCISSKSMLN